ncbi:MAG: hypothetical protein WDO16_01390 [Bacteroidota bacterium]
MGYLGYELGPCRLPLKQLNPQEIDTLRKELESVNFFELMGGQTVILNHDNYSQQVFNLSITYLRRNYDA